MIKPWNIGILTVTEEQVEIAKNNGLKRYNIQARLDNGWPIERAITQPVLKKRRLRYTEQDEMEAQLNGIEIGTFRSRVNCFGWSVEDAKTKRPQYISNQRGGTRMDWNRRIDGLKKELANTEGWVKENYDSIPTVLMQSIVDALQKSTHEIRRLELFVKDGQQ